MSVKAFNKDKESFVKIASLQSGDIVVDKSEFVSNNVSDALSELKRDVKSMQSNIAWIYNNGTIGGGGGSGTGSLYTGVIQVLNFDKDHNLILQDALAATVTLKVVSTLNTPFTVTVQATAGTTTISETRTISPNKDEDFNLGVVAKGTYSLKISGEDYTGFPMENWVGYIIKGILSISSSYSSSSEDAVGMYDKVNIPVTVTLSEAVKDRKLTVYYTWDDARTNILDEPIYGTTYSHRIVLNSANAEMRMGKHTITVVASIPDATGTGSITVSKNIDFYVYDSKYISIYIPTGTSSNYVIDNLINIPFGIIALDSYTSFKINYSLYKDGDTTVFESGTVDAIRGLSMAIKLSAFANNGYTAGKYRIELTGSTSSGEAATKEGSICEFEFNLNEYTSDIEKWDPEQSGLIASFDAKQISNFTQLDDKYYWNNQITNSDISLEIINPGTGKNGVIHLPNTDAEAFDPKTNDMVRLHGESYAVMSINPFKHSSEFTLEFLYKCTGNGDINSIITSCANYAVGTTTQLAEGITISETKFTGKIGGSGEIQLVDDEWVYCSIVCEQVEAYDGNIETLLKTYINGVLTSVFECVSSDLNKLKTSSLKLFLGARGYTTIIDTVQTDIVDLYSDVAFKTIRLYERALSSEEIVRNYIADDYYMHYAEGTTTPDATTNNALRLRNGFANGKKFDITSLHLPIVTVSFNNKDNAQTFRNWRNVTNEDELKVPIACNIRYESKPISASKQVIFDTVEWNSNASNPQITGCTIKVQGTTSKNYLSKNYDICFGNWSNNTDVSEQSVLFSPKTSGAIETGEQVWLPENVFTLKADVIDSSHSNNVGCAKIVSEISRKLKVSDSLPPMQAANNDNYDAIKFAIDGFPCLLYVYDNADEDENYGPNNLGTAKLYGVYMFDLGRESHFNLGYRNINIPSDGMSKAQGSVDCVAVKYTATDYENTFVFEGKDNQPGSSITFEDLTNIKTEWDRRFPLTGDDNVGITQFTAAATNAMNVLEHPDEFSPGTVWHQPACVSYLLCAYLLGMVDNLGKNLLVKTWDGVQWYPMFYDMDTVLGLNNTGQYYYRSNVDIDKYGENQGELQLTSAVAPDTDQYFQLSFGLGDGKGGGMYNATTSRLWNATRDKSIWYANLKNAYKTLRINDKFIEYQNLYNYYKSIQDNIGAMLYNYDADIKYLSFSSSGVRSNLDMLNGTRELHAKRWLKERIYYLDSLFELYDDGTENKSAIQIRQDWKNNIKPNVGVRTTCPVFVRRHTDMAGAPSEVLLLADNLYFTNYPINVEKGTNIAFEFYNAPLITNIRGISTGLGGLMISSASKLLELNIAGAKQIGNTVTVAGLNSLRVLNAQDCTFGENVERTLNLESAISLQTVNIANSGFTGLTLPAGGTLKKLDASNTRITSLKIVSQSLLEELNLTNCEQLNSIDITECNNLKKITITGSALTTIKFTQCGELEEVNISDNTKLLNVSFEACENVKKINLSGCTATDLAKYTGDEDVDKSNSLNLSGCPNLEELILSNCAAEVIRFSDNAAKIKTITANNSFWKQTYFVGTANAATGGTLNTYTTTAGDILPAINLSKFQSLESLLFYQNIKVQAITGIKYSGSCTNLFNGCASLQRIIGEITINANNTSMFSYMSNSFKLNDTYGSFTPGNSSTASPSGLKISIADNVTSLISLFAYNKGVTLEDCYYICGMIHSKITDCRNMFLNTLLMANSSGSLSADTLVSATGLTHCDLMFYAAGLSGQFPSSILRNCPVVSVTYMFAQNAFVSLSSGFAETIFKDKTRLTSCSHFLHNNYKLEVQSTEAIAVGNLFTDCENLTDCSYFMGIEHTYGDGAVTDSYIDGFGRRNLHVDLSTSDKLFRLTPNLTNCNDMFPKCICVGPLSVNLFGGADSSSDANYPTGVINARYMFHDSNVIYDFSAENATLLFSKLKTLAYVDGFASGNGSSRCDYITGDPKDFSSTLFVNNPDLKGVSRFFESTKISNTLQFEVASSYEYIHPLFKTNKLVSDVHSLFKNCTSITGSVPAGLFANCPSISDISQLFYGCTGISGSIPGSENDPNTCFMRCLNSNDSSGNYNSLNSASKLFYGCSSINTTIPASLFQYMPYVADVSYVFYGCGESGNSIVGIRGSVPSTLFANNVQLVNVSYLFAGCHALGTVNDEEGDECNVPETLFSSTTSIKSAAGMFQGIKIYKIPANLFAQQTNLTDISYMFNLCDRSEMAITSTLFQNNNNIKTIKFFAGETSNQASGYGISLRTSPVGLFFPYSSSSGLGQIWIQDVTGAFANNELMDGNAPVNFWNTTGDNAWKKEPTSTQGCYYGCTELDDYNSIDDRYKQYI